MVIKNHDLSQVQTTYLQFTNGPLAQQTIYLNAPETWIGRDPHNQIVIPDPEIELWHARLIWYHGHLFIQSHQQSLIIVNRQRISTTSRIWDGDEINLGVSNITFRLWMSHLPAQISPSLDQEDFPSIPMQAFPPVDQHNDTEALSYQIDPLFAQYRAAKQSTTSPKHLSLATISSNNAGSVISLTNSYAIDTTRYLCASAYFNEYFRAHVLKNIVDQEYRAPGKAYAIDIIPVVKWGIAAQKRTFVRDILLALIGLITLYFTLFQLADAASLLRAALTISQSTINAPASNFITNLLVLIAPLVQSPAFMFALLGLYLVVIALVLAAIRPFVPSKRRNVLSLIIFLLFFPTTLLPAYLLAWIVVSAEKVFAYNGQDVAHLKKDQFNPHACSITLDPAVEQKLKANFNVQEGNVVVYSGHEPFAGAGTHVGGWSFAVDISRRKQERNSKFISPPFQIRELYAYIVDKIEALGMSGLSKISIEDELFVNGQQIRDDKRFIDNVSGCPYTQVDSAVIKEFMENPSQDIRHYKCIRVTSHQQKMILSIFLKFVLAGQNLFVETNYLLLSPLAEEYRQIDTLAPKSITAQTLILARQAFFPTLHLVAHTPDRLFSYLFRKQYLQQQHKSTRCLLQNDPVFDYGASSSLRQFVSSSPDTYSFQKLDKEMYLKIIECQLLEGIQSFLDIKNIDTTDLKERTATLLNNAVLQSTHTLTEPQDDKVATRAHTQQKARISADA